MNLRKKSETATEITLEWDLVPGAIGYRFQSKTTAPKWSHNWDANDTEVKFSKAEWYKVEALATKDAGFYPPPVDPPPPSGTLPLVSLITKGGTYSGTISGSGSAAAVRVQTAEPVEILNSVINHSGTGFGIEANYPGAKLTVKKCVFNGGFGQCCFPRQYDLFHFENNTVNKYWGLRYDAGRPGSTSYVGKNRFRNQFFHTPSNGNGFWLAHAIQPASTPDPKSSIIEWNECIGDFGIAQTEDLINIYDCARVICRHNYCEGAYPLSLNGGGKENDSGSYTGGGIIIDGPRAKECEISDCIVVDTIGYLVGISGGTNSKLLRNYGVCDTKNDAGQYFTNVASQGLGLYIANYSGQGAPFSGNVADGNTMGAITNKGVRNDQYIAQGGVAHNTTSLPDPIDRQKEIAAWGLWQQKVAAAGVVIGA